MSVSQVTWSNPNLGFKVMVLLKVNISKTVHFRDTVTIWRW